MQYIAIFSTTNTIYCNILHHQYNILQYSLSPIQCIGDNILYYIILYCIVLYCIEMYCVKVDHQSSSSSSPSSLSLLSEEFSLTTNASNEGFHSVRFLFRNSSASNVLGCRLQRDGQNTHLAIEKSLSTSFDVDSRKLVLMYALLAFLLCRH